MDELSKAISTVLGAIIVITIGAVIFNTMGSDFTFNSFNSEKSESTYIEQEQEEAMPISLVEAPHLSLVKKHCLGCHSDKLISQNRMSLSRWKETIVWMQETQGLWQMGKDEPKVLEYLATNYGPIYEGRRKQIDIEEIKWYVLEM